MDDELHPPALSSCVFVCHDGAGHILLARRSAGARDEAGCWDCGAGAIEPGESVEEAVAREVHEEYGVTPQEIVVLGCREVVREVTATRWTAAVCAVRVDPSRVVNGEPHKLDELRWVTPDEVPSPAHSQLAPTLALFRAGRT